MEEKKRVKLGWGISLFIHMLLFILVGMTGYFMPEKKEEKPPVEVFLYEQAVEVGGSTAFPSGEIGAEADNTKGATLENSSRHLFQEKFLRQREEKIALNEGMTKNRATKESTGQEVKKTSGNSGYKNKGIGSGGSGSTGYGAGGNVIGNGVGAGNGMEAREKRAPIAPKLINSPEPIYPESLRARNIKGKVLLKLTVSQEGQVEAVEILESSGYDSMDAAAIEAAWQYRYTPAYNEYGEKVRFIKRARMEFRLK